MRRALLLVCVATLGCGDPVTEIVLVIDTDIPSVDGFEVVADFEDGPQRSTADLGQQAAPRQLVLIHEGGALGPIDLRIEATGGGATLASVERRVSFERGESLTLRVFLSQACSPGDCGAGSTCGNDGRCRPGEVLPCEYEGRECDMDAGGMDAGGPDAGAPDAGVDSGPGDAGTPMCPDGPCTSTLLCPSDCRCESRCLVRCAPGTDCSPECENGGRCAIDVRGARSANVLCDQASCEVWAMGARSVTVTVTDSSSAEIDCTGASSCTVDCVDDACLVDCTDVPAGDCSLNGCTPSSCAGDVLVCRRMCP